MAIINLYDLARDRFIEAERAVAEAPEAMDDNTFHELVQARNQAAHALAERPCDGLHQLATKLYALGCIVSPCEAGSYGNNMDVLMVQSIKADFDRLAPLPAA